MRDGKLLRYRCHVGHVYTADGLVAKKETVLENVLWSALRALEESVALRVRMARRAREGNIPSIAENLERRAREDEARASLLRQFLVPEDGTPARATKRTRTKTTKRQRRGPRTPKQSEAKR
jgi:two-component system chemotaxis response regulator CheB